MEYGRFTYLTLLRDKQAHSEGIGIYGKFLTCIFLITFICITL
jgi:hypothetical protein